MIIYLAILALSLVFDLIYPFHKGLLLKIHPVHTCYVLSKKLFKPYGSRSYGILIWFICILVHIIPLYLLIRFLNLYAKDLYTLFIFIIISSWILKTSFSIRLLMDIGIRVYEYSKSRDIELMRRYTQYLVRRDVYSLDEPHVLSACIESIAESLVDGIVSPLLYYPFIGIWGPLIQRLANTLDGIIGYKTPEYKNIGWFSAKIDTLLNYIPARLASLYIILSSMILGYNWRDSIKTYLKDRSRTESLNAGHPISAVAGALRVRLEKIDQYVIGEKFREAKAEDVYKAIEIAISATFIHIIIVTLLVLAINPLLA